MKNLILLFLLSILFISFASAAQINSANQSNNQNVTVYFIYGNGCPHCANVEASGVLEKVAQYTNLVKYEVYNNADSRAKALQISQKAGVGSSGVPLAIIEKNNSYSYLLGDTPIINGLEDAIANFKPTKIIPTETKTITLWAVIAAALVDSINPCALGVLAFLMISLLRIGSSKRALRAGIIYSFVVFFVYMLSGFGIFKAIQAFTSATHYIYLVAGSLVLILGILQLIDSFFPGKFISLRIPKSAKPIIENVASKGTIPAVILLGIIVALFELPCTGGIYIGILTLLSTNAAHGLEYLIVYNLLFIIPLLVATFIIYKGTSPEVIEKWSQGEKRWMKLASGIVMIALGIYMLGV